MYSNTHTHTQTYEATAICIHLYCIGDLIQGLYIDATFLGKLAFSVIFSLPTAAEKQLCGQAVVNVSKIKVDCFSEGGW